jgi:hypothetical protein
MTKCFSKNLGSLFDVLRGLLIVQCLPVGRELIVEVLLGAFFGYLLNVAEEKSQYLGVILKAKFG